MGIHHTYNASPLCWSLYDQRDSVAAYEQWQNNTHHTSNASQWYSCDKQ